MYDVWEEWERLTRAFCDNYTIHPQHIYTAINGESYDCAGFTATDLADLITLEAQPPCEHGLSAHLCAGPGHYPMEDDDRW